MWRIGWSHPCGKKRRKDGAPDVVVERTEENGHKSGVPANKLPVIELAATVLKLAASK